jgi:hypothetical protein
VRFAAQQAARGVLSGDPLAGTAGRPTPTSIRISFAGPSRVACHHCGDAGPDRPEPARDVRIRLVRAAQEGAPVLRVASAASFAHPQAADLLREATRLCVPRVEAAGEGSALDEWPEGALARLAPLARVDVALYGPDAARHDTHMDRPGALEATLRGLERLARLTGTSTGAYAILHDPTPVADYAAQWARGVLPGPPAFRLSSRGAALESLAAGCLDLDDGAAREALAETLPACLVRGLGSARAPHTSEEAWGNGRQERIPPSGSDRYGTYEPCPRRAECAQSQRCPGLPAGWTVSPDALVPFVGAHA